MAYTMIETKYLGATNHRGSRIVARRNHRRVTIPYNPGMTPLANHSAAAMILANEMTTKGRWIAADKHDGDGMVFVLIADRMEPAGFTTV
jgi:hypothetical protein